MQGHKACLAGQRKGIRVAVDTIPELTDLLQPPKTRRLNGIMLEYLLLAAIGQTDTFPALATQAVLEVASAPRMTSPSDRPSRATVPAKGKGSEGNPPSPPMQKTPTSPPPSAPISPIPVNEESTMDLLTLPAESQPIPLGRLQPPENTFVPSIFINQGTDMPVPSVSTLMSSAAGAAMSHPQTSACLPFFPTCRPEISSAQRQSPPSPQLLDLSMRNVDHMPMQSRPLSSTLQLGSGYTTEGDVSGDCSRPVSAATCALTYPAPSLTTVYRSIHGRDHTGLCSSDSAVDLRATGFRLDPHCSGSGLYQAAKFDSVLVGERSSSKHVTPYETSMSVPWQSSAPTSNVQPLLGSDVDHSAEVPTKRLPFGEPSNLASPAKRHASEASVMPMWSRMYCDLVTFADEKQCLPKLGTLGGWTEMQLDAARLFSARLLGTHTEAKNLMQPEITCEQYQSLIRVPTFVAALRSRCQPGTVPHVWNVAPMPRASHHGQAVAMPATTTITSSTASIWPGYHGEATGKNIQWPNRGGSTSHNVLCSAPGMSGAEASSAPSICTGIGMNKGAGGVERWTPRSGAPSSKPFPHPGT
jgi:hypothetical protein